MNYDPIKKSLGKVFNSTPALRIFFYKLLDVLLLRTWHVKRMVKRNLYPRRGEALHFLDAGMGFGQYSYWLVSKFPKCFLQGIDVKEEQVIDCNRFFMQINKPNAIFACADLLALSDKDMYDFILNVDVMEHIEEDEQVLCNFYRALKPDGCLLISTPSDLGGSDVHDEHEESFIGEHVRNGYSVEDITAKLKRAGFGKIYTTYSYGLYGHISWILSMKIPILSLNFSKWLLPVVFLYYLVVAIPCLILNLLDVYGHNHEGTGLIVWAEK